MAKSTPHFNDMVAARGGMGMKSGGKQPAPPKAPAAKMTPPAKAPSGSYDC